MELRHLRYFVQVAADLHFGRAAAHLGISQPPLSQQIRLLEEELGVMLLERTSRRVVLTRAGVLFLDAARRTLSEADRAVLIARRAALGELGVLRIGFNASAPFIPLIAATMFAFREGHPDVDLTLTEVAGSAQIAAIGDGLLDLGFLRSPARPAVPAGLTTRLILKERLLVATRTDNALAMRTGLHLSDLTDQSLVVYSSDKGGGFTETLLALMRTAGVDPRIAQSVREVSTLLGLVAAGIGITIIAESLSSLQSAGLAYIPLLDERATSEMWLVHTNAPSFLVQRFLNVLVDAGEGASGKSAD
jgi:DNA-binding transcriptional LysR family regulator